MKTALVLGVTGNFGEAMAQALQKRGWKVKALVRNPEKLTAEQRGYEIIHGDFQDTHTLKAAAQGADLLVYAINPPYDQWKQSAMTMLEPVVTLAEQNNLHILFPGNVYTLKPSNNLIDEKAKPDPVSTKGSIRVDMEARLRKASQCGARITIVRAGDFIGERGQWISYALKRKRDHYTLQLPHSETHRHYWSYLPDLSANAAQLIERQHTSFAVWNDPGLVLTIGDWQQAFESNGIVLKTRRFPWWVFHLISVFSPMLKEVIEMKYLWEDELVLDGSKMRRELGEAMQETGIQQIVKDLVEVGSNNVVKKNVELV
ncbi:NAD(P)H-binding protein [Vibrio sp. SCSIO 43136]|uniref:NAD(P)H-binding protein n=1 Tax=Vibrio sp. SCSIO 43136 TaxID=2819101 RepID=UPI002074D1AF|nr:NAD(P)H-binding protein [Vibrio sp. SCSIO 43136]USD68029.1 NAD(P)H-binding protein [Vibrio sp. SCSIO 43136]